jgi:hypothetical protein
MSFYITLPSNASMETYPDNKMSNYTTKLKSPIKLDDEWQVALVEFTYRQSINIKLGEMIIFKDEKIFESIDIEGYEGETLSDLFNNIETKLKKIFLDKKLYIKFTIESNNIKIKIKELLSTDEIQYDQIENDSNKKKISTNNNYFVQLSGILPIILECSKNKFFDNDELSNIYTAKSIIHKNESFYFYTDIIDYQFVGDTKAPLLTTASIIGEPGNAIQIFFENPQYVDVNKSELFTINIQIKNSQDEFIRFSNNSLSNVIVKLHFRPKKYEF